MNDHSSPIILAVKSKPLTPPADDEGNGHEWNREKSNANERVRLSSEAERASFPDRKNRNILSAFRILITTTA